MNVLFSLVTLIVLLASPAISFPRLDPESLQELLKRGTESKPCPVSENHAHARTKRQMGFDPIAQRVSTSGKYVWKAPNLAAGDKRGPCPGLNALANHGYLPHNGVAPATAIIQAVNQVYGVALDLGTFLAAFGTVFNGDPLSLTPGFSIGGPASLGLGGTLSSLGVTRTPSGLSGSHNNYEGDTSATRGDLYSVGNNDLLQLPLFEQYYDALLENTPAPQQYSALFPFRQARFNHSIHTNPYFFFPQFAGVFVSHAGYAFPPALMSNKSTQYPSGYLDKATFKSFFGVTGEPGNFKYQPGYERIPENWYKRAVGDEYTIPDFIASVLEYAQQDPRLLSIGGNTGTTDSFTGLDPTNFTNGIYNAATLAEGNNLQCFIFQLVQAEAPGVLAGVYGDLTTKALEVLRESVGKSLEGLGCPELRGVEGGMYERFPG